MKFSVGLRNIPGVENYSVALTNFHGGTFFFFSFFQIQIFYLT